MVIEKVFEDNRYTSDEDLFNYLNADQHELTVTITLAEYRALLKDSIKATAQKKELDWLTQYQRANEAENRVQKLEAELDSAKAQLDTAKSLFSIQQNAANNN